jgi:hypothetical protein
MNLNKENNKNNNKDNNLKDELKKPTIIDDYSGIINLRGTCGEKPCKGKYQ